MSVIAHTRAHVCVEVPYSLFAGISLLKGLLRCAEVPPKLAAYGLGYTTNLFGTLTHYASGQAAAYYGAGYLAVPSIFYQGAAISIWNIAIWFFPGVGWMKLVGGFF